MSYGEREPLPRRQKWLAIAAIALIMPVILDAVHIIYLGGFRLLPFLILLAAAPFASRRDAKETTNG